MKPNSLIQKRQSESDKRLYGVVPSNVEETECASHEEDDHAHEHDKSAAGSVESPNRPGFDLIYGNGRNFNSFFTMCNIIAPWLYGSIILTLNKQDVGAGIFNFYMWELLFTFRFILLAYNCRPRLFNGESICGEFLIILPLQLIPMHNCRQRVFILIKAVYRINKVSDL